MKIMLQLRTAVKLTFALLAVWLGLVWAGLLPRSAILPQELDIEPLTYLLGAVAATRRRARAAARGAGGTGLFRSIF